MRENLEMMRWIKERVDLLEIENHHLVSLVHEFWSYLMVSWFLGSQAKKVDIKMLILKRKVTEMTCLWVN